MAVSHVLTASIVLDDNVHDAIDVHAVAGDSVAHNMHMNHLKNPGVDSKSVCIVDGDSVVALDEVNMVFALPGDAPELYVYDCVMERFSSVGGKLSVALLQKFDESDQVKDKIESAKIQNRDHHVLYGQIGEALGLIPEETVQLAFLTIWAQSYEEEVERIGNLLKTTLSDDNSDS